MEILLSLDHHSLFRTSYFPDVEVLSWYYHTLYLFPSTLRFGLL